MDEKSMESATLLQPGYVQVAEVSSSAGSRSISLSPNLSNSSRHTTPVMEHVTPEPNSRPADNVQNYTKPIPKAFLAKSLSATVAESALRKPKAPPGIPIKILDKASPTFSPVGTPSTAVTSVFQEPNSFSEKPSQIPASATPKASSEKAATTPFIRYVPPETKPSLAKRARISAKASPMNSMKAPSSSATRPVFIHPPFTAFPESRLHPEGLSYDLMAANAEWFLDPADFVSTGSNSPSAIPYPRKFEPSSMTMLAVTDGNRQLQEDRRLRCTFCRKTYTGEDAEVTWRNHILEQHNIVLSVHRYDNDDQSVTSITSTLFFLDQMA
jgi:hypothetical protein